MNCAPNKYSMWNRLCISEDVRNWIHPGPPVSNRSCTGSWRILCCSSPRWSKFDEKRARGNGQQSGPAVVGPAKPSPRSWRSLPRVSGSPRSLPKLKDYQLEGLAWMIGLHSQEISGLLADEMGLGKTLQTTAFTAYLQKITRPILIVCPLSVMHNWISEYTRFALKIPVLMYHGSPQDRAELRQKHVPIPADYPPNGRGAKFALLLPKKGKGRGRKLKALVDEERPFDLDAEQTPEEKALNEKHDKHFKKFPVVATTYDLIIRDREKLKKTSWGYIVVDESHRLKSMGCALMREIKRYLVG
uniref:Helicase ATP-binding domain-containing protein n=1 Tax=Mycena chlorophos TaxID=658473 RepID=A0ABQ0LEF8_MYCCL|nr:predicted protein [Mycena chlorophos]